MSADTPVAARRELVAREAADPFDPARVLGAPEPLRAFNEAGVLAAADVHVAVRLVAFAAEDDPAVALAAALAVRAPRLGHVYVDVATIRDTAAVEGDEPVDLSALPWPEPADWLARLSASGLVGDGRPLRLAGTALYLDRYWHEEGRLAEDLRAFTEAAPAEVDEAALAAGLARLFPDGGRQREAAEVALRRRFAVIAGGPGTGKTTTLARIVALLADQGAPLVALAAPTGKAAARLEETVHAAAGALEVPALLALEASTLHLLLGRRPGSHSRFRHHRGNRLPHDVVIVDETSMVSLSLMARLVEAVRPDARLILVGDPGQLASIEAGAVLGDIVGPTPAPQEPPAPGAAGPASPRPAAPESPRPAAPESPRDAVSGRASPRPAAPASPRNAGSGPASRLDAVSGIPSPRDAIVVLDRVHRFGAGIAALAQAVRAGDGDEVIAVLREAPEGVTWLPVDVAGSPDALAPVRDGAVAAAGAVIAAAEAGDGAAAIAALGAFRVLCGHRRGAHGVSTWVERIEGWLTEAVPGFAVRGRWYPGRPLLVTENDYGLGLYNGDTGVIVAAPDGRMSAAFERRGELLRLPPTRLAAVDTVYAMTVHKSQGSQYETAAVLLPEPTSRVLTRELLYTAVTRARRSLILAGTEEAVRAAVARPIARASGLGARLWGAA